jgi:hypothetical protein
MDRKTPSVSDVVRRAVELCDPDDVDQTLGRLEEQLEDDDEPITAGDAPAVGSSGSWPSARTRRS